MSTIIAAAVAASLAAALAWAIVQLRQAKARARAWREAAEDQAWINHNMYVPLREGSTCQVEIADPARSILTPLLDGPDYRFAGPTQACLCGNELFHAVVSFDEDQTIGYYLLDGICHACGATVNLPYETHEIGA